MQESDENLIQSQIQSVNQACFPLSASSGSDAAMPRINNKDLGIPRPCNSYSIFVQKCHRDYSKVLSNARLRRKVYGKQPVASDLSKRWKSMSAEERQPFVDQAKDGGARNRSLRKQALAERRCSKEPLPTEALELGRGGGGAALPSCTFNLETIMVSSILGSGTYGTVKLGVTTLSRVKYAIKFGAASRTDTESMPSTPMNDKTVVAEQDLVREKCLLSKLKHPSIVQCFGLVALSGKLGLVLELCDGNLRQWLEANAVPMGSPGPPEHLLHGRDQMFLQVAGGLHYIHTQRVLHLDVKTNNCLVCASGVVKLADFGLAIKFKDSRGVLVQGQCVYNFCYRPPECDVNTKAGKCCVCDVFVEF